MNKLREIRESKHLSRSKLAAQAGIDGKTIYRIENGVPPSVDTARALAGALGCTLDDLFPVEEVPA